MLDKYLGYHSPGYIIEIYNNGERQELIAGNTTTNPATPCASDTLYDIASLTKTYTAVLIYMAHEAGLLDVNDSVTNIDHRFVNLQNVKILDLLSHRQDIWTKGYLGNAKTKADFYQTLFSAYIKDATPTYVDAHYIILSTILEKIYDLNYAEILQTNLLDRLSLAQTTINPAGRNIAPSTNNPAELGIVHDRKARTARTLRITTGHASIFTTGGELLTFLESFLKHTLLQPTTIQQMLKHAPNNLYNYMGARPIDRNGKVIEFSGYTGPTFLIDFERQIIIAVMCNVLLNSKLERAERKRITSDIIQEIYTEITGSK